MAEQDGLGRALRTIRKARCLAQEDITGASSRTYMSTLERGLKSPTWEKLVSLCDTMQVHPATLVTLVYANDKARRMRCWHEFGRNWMPPGRLTTRCGSHWLGARAIAGRSGETVRFPHA
ncbi:hypothetical protein PIGHUM_03184 [Pigmentiphaga humi]|uniref:Helix-turn-helix domain protein n=1 Tax=Pigmentiphaga humi TaxID=2478468 RepID=A0A3P4B476_9BURK|nr:hypothetical protein PIGHUM_03184 [Pigmentiphaga humi]